MIRYYKGTIITEVTDVYYSLKKINVPAGVVAKGIDTTTNGEVIFKADVNEAQHGDIISLGNAEIPEADLVAEINMMFPNQYSVEEIEEWKI